MGGEDLGAGVTLYQGDCLDVLPTLAGWSVDAVVTDPPYGTEAERDGYGRRGKWGGSQKISGDTDMSLWGPLLSQSRRLLRLGGWCVVWCSPKRRDEAGGLIQTAGARVVGEVVWDKTAPGIGGGLRYQHETALLVSFGRSAGGCQIPSVWAEWVPKGQHGHRQQHHVHEKPARLSAALVRYVSRPGDLILDPFAGSGTTGVAALAEGRRCILIEKEPAYCDIIRSRIAEASGTGPGSLFHQPTLTGLEG